MSDASGHEAPGPLCLVTGASGYIGGRLVPELLEAGFRVRCLARTPAKLRDHPWAGEVETVQGDVTDAETLVPAFRDVDVAYYLVHALGAGRGFERTDRTAAENFARQARAAGVGRIVLPVVRRRRVAPTARSRSAATTGGPRSTSAPPACRTRSCA